jgi:hypothetical protein
MGKQHAEHSAGFEGSAVMFRKIGPCKEAWNSTLQQIDKTAYPDDEAELARHIKAAGSKSTAVIKTTPGIAL